MPLIQIKKNNAMYFRVNLIRVYRCTHYTVHNLLAYQYYEKPRRDSLQNIVFYNLQKTTFKCIFCVNKFFFLKVIYVTSS